MHYVVIFFYPRKFTNPFGHVDFLLFNEHGTYKFNFDNGKKPFEKRPYKLTDQFNAPTTCTEAFVICIENTTNQYTFLDYMFKTCSELTRLFSQVDVGFCLTPMQLYKKLIKYDTKRNFTILQRHTKNGSTSSTR